MIRSFINLEVVFVYINALYHTYIVLLFTCIFDILSKPNFDGFYLQRMLGAEKKISIILLCSSTFCLMPLCFSVSTCSL